jgi:D-alanine-D-alanine ligase
VTPDTLRVIVLAGGRSAERDVSRTTGRAVAEALGARGHEVTALEAATGEPLALGAGDEIAALAPAAEGDARGAFSPAVVDKLAPLAPDVVFLALHGTGGEDGTLQGLLDLAGVVYTGSGRMASTVAINKRVSRAVFEAAGVPVADGDWFPSALAAREIESRKVLDRLGGPPVVVKPNDQGSSVGITIVEKESEYAGAVGLAARLSTEVLVERYVEGREVTVGILGDEALPVVEMIPREGFYDYEAKYQTGHTEYLCPAPVDDAVAERLQRLALKAFRALGCEGFARVDFRLDPSGRPFCLEVNTIPGLTATSLLPKAAQAVGIGFPELVERICRLAIERATERGRGSAGERPAPAGRPAGGEGR